MPDITPVFHVIDEFSEVLELILELPDDGPGYYEISGTFPDWKFSATVMAFERLEVAEPLRSSLTVDRWCPTVETFDDGFSCLQHYSLEGHPVAGAFFDWSGQLTHSTADEGALYLGKDVLWSREGNFARLRTRTDGSFSVKASIEIPQDVSLLRAQAATAQVYWFADGARVFRVDGQAGEVSEIELAMTDPETWIGSFADNDHWVFARHDGYKPGAICRVSRTGGSLDATCEEAGGRVLAGEKGRFWVCDGSTMLDNRAESQLILIDSRSVPSVELGRRRVPPEFCSLDRSEREPYVPTVTVEGWHGYAQPPGEQASEPELMAVQEMFGSRQEIFRVAGGRLFFTVLDDGFNPSETVVIKPGT